MKDTEGKSTEMFEFHFPAKELAGPVLYLRAVGMPHCPPAPGVRAACYQHNILLQNLPHGNSILILLLMPFVGVGIKIMETW